EKEPYNARLLVMRGWAYALHHEDYKLAESDFARAAKIKAADRESRLTRANAYSGLGIVHVRQKSPAQAQAAAAQALALLYRDDSANSYIIVHNVACIFAELAEVDRDQARTHQDVALEHIRRALDLWRRGGKKEPNEAKLIEIEATSGSFRSLKKLP